MSTPTRTHTYKGFRLTPCQSANAPHEHKGHWAIRTTHTSTGIPWADQECTHAYSLAVARQIIDGALRAAIDA